jgi:integrase
VSGLRGTRHTGVYQRCRPDCPDRCGRHRFAFVIDLPAEPGQKRRQRWQSGFTTAAEAARERRGALAEMDGGAPPPPRRDSTTLGAYLIGWPATVPHIKPATVDAYGKAARYVSADPTGARPLQRLTPADLRALYRRLRDRGLSAATVALVHAVVVRALGDALADGMVRSNPARADRVAPKLGTRPEAHVWTADQASAFLAATSGDRLAALWRVALTTGLRRGELLGLRWDDLDLDAGTLTVRRTLGVIAGKVVEGPPKTAAARRTIALDAGTVTAVREHRKQLVVERLAAGPAWAGDDRVFCKVNGRPIHPNTIGHALNAAADAAKVPHVTVHGLRHTSATLSLHAGRVPVRVLSERLGHANVTVTLRTYAHALTGDDAAAADAIAEVLG